MKKEWFVKPLAICIVVLFIGTSILNVSAINTNVDIDLKNKIFGKDLVEVIVNICKINKIENYKIILTQKKADELNNLFNNFKVKLDNSLTMKDTIEIYYELVESLNKIGLIPRGVSVQEAKQLITDKKSGSNAQHIVNIVNNLEDNENMFCYIYGYTSQTCFFTKIGRPIFIFNIPPMALANTICYGIWPWPLWPLEYKSYFQAKKEEPPTYWHPASGYVYTNGLNGKITWNGEFYGQISPDFYSHFFSYTVSGVKGFRGFHFYNSNNDSWYYFGHAMHVKLGTKQPPDPPYP